MPLFDVVILTESRYVNPQAKNEYIENILLEDQLLQRALQGLGLKVTRKDWADPDFEWSETKCVVFKTTWDYFDRFTEFKDCLSVIQSKTTCINPASQIIWNMDKWYLKDLADSGIPVVETEYIKKGEQRPLREIISNSGWDEVILKPTVAGAARHTYRIMQETIQDYESIFCALIKEEDMMIQPFQHNIMTKGEASFMVIGGGFTHAVLKKGKTGDFRVQDDFGGTVHKYLPSQKEIEFAEKVVQACEMLPAYARVDVMWDNNNELAVSEVELIEPELWFRKNPEAAQKLAKEIQQRLADLYPQLGAGQFEGKLTKDLFVSEIHDRFQVDEEAGEDDAD